MWYTGSDVFLKLCEVTSPMLHNAILTSAKADRSPTCASPLREYLRHHSFSESDRTSELGCWDGLASLKAAITNWITTKPTPDFQSSDEYCDYLIDTGLGEGCDAVAEAYWVKAVKADCQDEDDLKRIRIVAINLVGRDSLYTRLPDSTCPVLWMHRTKLPCIVGWKDASLVTGPGGQHVSSAYSPTTRSRLSSLLLAMKEANKAMRTFVDIWAAKQM
ncbi:uncharacterized protein RSE6_01261 [Rhynchosporium secalis]|uniref:Uncharacterized protein n=1 Tax=Rhynchosporium secalis TaxID=38038 RepID=A0A1E1LZ04_RHYSE|nr:uncharacterized protein RSE6_01261 [Rhynchosporium secalis]